MAASICAGSVITVILFILQIIHQCRSDDVIRDVSQKDLEELVKKEPLVLVFLYQENCDSCKKGLDVLLEFGGHDLINIVKSKDVDVVVNLWIQKRPALVLYRSGTPVIYPDELEDVDDLVHWLRDAEEKKVRDLNDDTFEHDTQASTGATTGDWCVLFYRESCGKVLPIWEALGVRMHRTLNIAKTDLDASPALKERFNIDHCPTAIYFTKGQMYKHELRHTDFKFALSFVEGWYKNLPGKKVPKVATKFDQLTEAIARALEEKLQGPDGWFYAFVIGGGLSLFVVVLLALCCRRSTHEKAE